MTDQTYKLTPVGELKEGMLLDLEEDPYATLVTPHFLDHHPKEDIDDRMMDIAALRFEHAVVEAIEREVGEFEPGVPFDVVVVYTDLMNFGCPHEHRVKVLTRTVKEA